MNHQMIRMGLVVIVLTAACHDSPIPFDTDAATTTLSHSSSGQAYISPFDHGYPIDSAGTYRWNIHADGVVDGYWCTFEWYKSYPGGGRSRVHQSQAYPSAGQCLQNGGYAQTYACGVTVPSFTLDVVVSQGSAFPPPPDIFSYVHDVPITSPFPCPPPPGLSVEITGPTSISSSGENVWAANASEGSGGYTYEWYRKVDYWWPRGSATCHYETLWELVGTGQSYSSFVSTGDYDFRLKVIVHSAGESAAHSIWVIVGDGSQICPE